MAELKQRHGCLTAWLVFMIIMNALTAGVYLFAGAPVQKAFPNAPAWALPVMAIAAIANVLCAFALFSWKKWGFVGFVVTSLFAFVMNLVIGTNVISAVLGLVGIAFLYGVLQIGGEKKGWSQLE